MATKSKKTEVYAPDKTIVEKAKEFIRVKKNMLLLVFISIIFGIVVIGSGFLLLYINEVYGKNNIIKINNQSQNAMNTTTQINVELSENTVIFFHANWCQHCQTMKPIVNELIQAGYPIVNAETNTEIGKLIAVKYPNIHSIPTFICYGSGKTKIGKQNKEALIDFVDKCRVEGK